MGMDVAKLLIFIEKNFDREVAAKFVDELAVLNKTAKRINNLISLHC